MTSDVGAGERCWPSAEFTVLREGLERTVSDRPRDLQSVRAEYEAWAASRPLPDGIRIVAAAAPFITPSEWLTMSTERLDGRDGAALLFVHGGGFRVGSVGTGRPLAAWLVAACGVPAINAHYRLAPEYPFPAGLSDVCAAYVALCAVNPGGVIVVGESAGGGLLLSMMLWARDAGLPLPQAGYLISPAVDLSAVAAGTARDPMLDATMLRQMREDYLSPPDAIDDPLISPVHAELGGLPPLLIQFGGAECLAPSIRLLVERLHAADCPVQVEEWPEMFHGWPAFAGDLPEAADALESAARFIRCVLGLS